MKVYVGNLPKHVTDEQLTALVLPFGKPESASVVSDRVRGAQVSRGFGFVVFGSDDEGQAAIAGLNGKDVDGHTLTVNVAKSSAARH